MDTYHEEQPNFNTKGVYYPSLRLCVQLNDEKVSNQQLNTTSVLFYEDATDRIPRRHLLAYGVAVHHDCTGCLRFYKYYVHTSKQHSGYHRFCETLLPSYLQLSLHPAWIDY